VPPALHHLAIQCADLAACERFYVDLLGLPVVRRWPAKEGGDRSVWLGLEGGAFLALERLPTPPPGAPAPPPAGPEAWGSSTTGLHLLALRIGAGERASWRARLAAAGVAVVHETGWTLYLRDPEGNRIGLSHHPEDAT
jgi:catechol 2,3-dioxygenase-like lactoylglutathione lyase family enzyme